MHGGQRDSWKRTLVSVRQVSAADRTRPVMTRRPSNLRPDLTLTERSGPDLHTLEIDESSQQVLTCQANLNVVCRLDVVAIVHVEHGIRSARHERALLLVVAHE